VPPRNPAPGSAREWLDRARGKLALARQPLPDGGYYEDLCFLTQQAAELAIKAVYQAQGWMFPFVHDLRALLDGLERQGLGLPSAVRDADQLSIYAVQARYPGVSARVTGDEFLETLRIADAVVAWAQSFLPSESESPEPDLPANTPGS
jgi:HEPN domain-containing protein